MNLLVLGINHQSAPLDLRESIAFSSDQIDPALSELRRLALCGEAVILSTCNRTEVITVGDPDGLGALKSWLANHHGIHGDLLEPHFYHFTEADAARHMMRVACGLDSMVLGEPQILGQVKAAFEQAKAAGAVSTRLHRLFQATFEVAKQVRTETEIGQHLISMPAAAVRLAQNLFTQLSECHCLLIGVGEMIQLSAKQLQNAGVTELTITNRTETKAAALAQATQAKTFPLEQLAAQLDRFDVIISATGAHEPLITAEMIEAALKSRRHAPIFMVDLAVPRDIHPGVGRLRDIYLYSLDDLQNIVSENLDQRRAAAAEAETIIVEAIDRFIRNEKARAGQNLVISYRQQLEAVKNKELERALERLQQGDDPEALLTLLANQITQKIAHSPSVELRRLISEGDDIDLNKARRLLGLEPEEQET
ncbi:MAG: glutamyl-tRNA reductase [Pseudomonadales bacterium]